MPNRLESDFIVLAVLALGAVPATACQVESVTPEVSQPTLKAVMTPARPEIGKSLTLEGTVPADVQGVVVFIHEDNPKAGIHQDLPIGFAVAKDGAFTFTTKLLGEYKAGDSTLRIDFGDPNYNYGIKVGSLDMKPGTYGSVLALTGLMLR